MSSQFSIVRLRVKAATEYGQVVHVSGSSFTMGNFSTSEAMPLVTTPEEYPYWRTSQPLVIPRGVPQVRRSCVCRTSDSRADDSTSQLSA